MPITTCCEVTAPIVVGDTAVVITVHAGSPDVVDDIIFYAQGCDSGDNNCAYQDIYDDIYCDVTEGGMFPNAAVTDTIYRLTELPPGTDLVIDAIERTVKVVSSVSNQQLGGLDALSWSGIFEWMEASKGGCMQVCIDGTEAHVNADTTVEITTADREL